MVPKCELFESIPLHTQELKCQVDVCELKDHVGEERLSSNWSLKLGLIMKTLLASFLGHLLECA
jgi:hypothetical protein